MRCRWLRNIGLGGFLCVGMLGLGLLLQPAGGATDMLGRIIASEAEKLMGQNVVAVNRVGVGVRDSNQHPWNGRGDRDDF